ncbi:MAG TPA: GNAT family N-acetyltransferase [Solirubrobacteraceae bacterium]
MTAVDLSLLWREQGPKAALAFLRDIARAQLYVKSDEMVLLKELASDDPTATRTIRLEEADAHHLPLLAEFNRRQCNTSRTPRFEKGLAEGKRALLGFRDGRLIGYIWWHDATQAVNGFYLSRFGVELADDDVYGYDLFIAPEHRGRGTPAEFVASVEAELARRGYRRMYGFVDGGNMPARWLWTTSGHEVVMRRHTRRVLRRLMFVEGRGWQRC